MICAKKFGDETSHSAGSRAGLETGGASVQADGTELCGGAEPRSSQLQVEDHFRNLLIHAHPAAYLDMNIVQI